MSKTPAPRGPTLIAETEYAGAFPVRLYQSAVTGAFKITYGAITKHNMTYEKATQEYGECLMHALGCAGKFVVDIDAGDESPAGKKER